MSDERGRKRDTPTGMGPVKPNPAHVPRGAGLSGNLPSGARAGTKATERGLSPARVRSEPQPPRAEPKQTFEPIPSGPWDAATTPPRGPIPEPMAFSPERGAHEHAGSGRPPPAPPARSRGADPVARAAADAFAVTRPAEMGAGGMRAFERAGGRSDPPERAAAAREVPAREVQRPPSTMHRPIAEPPHERAVSQRPGPEPGPSLRPGASPRPPEPPGHKPSLRLKLDVDADDQVNEGRVRVPKRRAPIVLGALLVLGAIAGGGLLWIDAHGGVDNFVAALKRVASGEPPQAVVAPQPPAAATEPAAQTTSATPPVAQAPAQQPQASAPAQQPAAEAPKATDQQAAAPGPQIATGEVEAPEEQPTATPQPSAAAAPEKPAAAKRPPAKPKPRVVKKQPVKRDPVIRIEQLGEGGRLLGAAPPDPSGDVVLPPPDPPAPE